MGPALVIAVALSASPPALPPLTAKEVRALEGQYNRALASATKAYGASEFDRMEEWLRECVGLARRLDEGGADGGTEVHAVSLNNLGFVLKERGKLADAEPLYREALVLYRRAYPKQDHLEVVHTLNNLALLLDARGKPAEAEPMLGEALDMGRRLYPKKDQPDVAVTLNNLGLVLNGRGKLAEAEDRHREALGMFRRLFPKQDHPNTAQSLNNLAATLEARGKASDAEPLFRDALGMNRRLFPDQDHPQVAQCLNNLGFILDTRGKAADAEPLYREALDMYRRLYPKQDHPDTAFGLDNVASVLEERGKLSDAEPLFREALGMRRRLYPKQDHPDTARSLNYLGALLDARGELADAEPLFREALAMRRRLYPKQDHPDTAQSLNNLAYLLGKRGKAADTVPLFREVLAMSRRLYPDQDHTGVANSLTNLGAVLKAGGKLADAEPLLREAVDMRRRLYPKRDHPEVVQSLNTLAVALDARGKAADAEELYREAVAMSRRLTQDRAGGLAEGDALTLAASLPRYRDCFLSNAVTRRSNPADLFAEVWADRGAISRVYEQRQLQARAATTDPAAAKLLSELADARIRRAELLHAPATTDEGTLKKREEELKAYEKAIEEKEKAVRPLLPAIARSEKLNKATPTDLQKALPADAVVVDFLHWTHFEFDPKTPGEDGEKQTPKYLAFVVTKTEIKWLDLGPADAIEKPVSLWREAITDPKTPVPADLGAKVRELVWQPVRKALPDGTKEVYVAPDAALCRLPWVALPGDKPGTVLLEDEFTVAAIPHAPFLLDHLWERDKSIQQKAGTLVVGGVDFDAKPATKVDPKAVQPELPLDAKAKPWKPLAGSKLEADGLLALAKAQKQGATSLSAADATPAAVLKALPQAKHAHFATHGFFADGKFRSAFQLDEKDYRVSLTGERVGRAANSPLVMTGLVLAGANHPATPGRGVVTGESLVDLDLSGLELAVLSACETGLGDVAGGEGTFGLQRAFHTAGTRNVVASLWSVSDAATAALMGEFYRQLWEKNLTPMQALKQAQLKVLKTDRKELGTLALRGPEASGVKDTVEANFPPGKSADGAVRNHPALWAAFTLSGPGR